MCSMGAGNSSSRTACHASRRIVRRGIDGSARVVGHAPRLRPGRRKAKWGDGRDNLVYGALQWAHLCSSLQECERLKCRASLRRALDARCRGFAPEGGSVGPVLGVQSGRVKAVMRTPSLSKVSGPVQRLVPSHPLSALSPRLCASTVRLTRSCLRAWLGALSTPFRHPGAAWERSEQAGPGRDPCKPQLALCAEMRDDACRRVGDAPDAVSDAKPLRLHPGTPAQWRGDRWDSRRCRGRRVAHTLSASLLRGAWVPACSRSCPSGTRGAGMTTARGNHSGRSAVHRVEWYAFRWRGDANLHRPCARPEREGWACARSGRPPATRPPRRHPNGRGARDEERTSRCVSSGS